MMVDRATGCRRFADIPCIRAARTGCPEEPDIRWHITSVPYLQW